MSSVPLKLHHMISIRPVRYLLESLNVRAEENGDNLWYSLFILQLMK